MHNPENERIKRAYFIYLKEARRLGEHSIDALSGYARGAKGRTILEARRAHHLHLA